MNYVSSYRKYRPLKFDDVVGQDHIVKTLKNAINNDKLAHAYLFNGPRGTGKTSIAKIFAREINCNCDDNSCIVCSLTNEETIPDIIEMDAASNNSVDEIRKIVESVNFVPLELKYKVYIIDEVHMLSKSAFNALLKTIEEPPKHVKFILATTEINKIPLTIISRTQRFDFKKINDKEIIDRLIYVLEQEDISYEIKALEKIAHSSDGGLRDALSLLDKVVMYEGEAKLNNVYSALNLVDEDNFEQLLKAIYYKETTNVVQIIAEIIESGSDEIKFVNDFQYYVREILLEVIAMKNLEYNRNVLIDYLKSLSELSQRLMHTRNYKILIEVYFIELSSSKEDVQPVLLTEKKQIPKTKQEDIEEQEFIQPQIEEEEFIQPQIEKEDYQPAKVEQEQPKTLADYVSETPTVVEEIQTSKQVNKPKVILDVLCDADKGLRKNLVNSYSAYANKCYDNNQRGLAKFFEVSNICAASQGGLVIAIDNDLLVTFNKRIKSIKEFISEQIGSETEIFLISIDEWNANKIEYANTVKKIKSNDDIYSKAVEIFGQDIVTKV